MQDLDLNFSGTFERELEVGARLAREAGKLILGFRDGAIEVDMKPGWGGPVYVNHSETDAPLAGVRVLLDGIEYGRTDERGQLLVEVAEAPKRVDFELDGFEVVRQSGWIDDEGEVISVGDEPISQYIGAVMRERD